MAKLEVVVPQTSIGFGLPRELLQMRPDDLLIIWTKRMLCSAEVHYDGRVYRFIRVSGGEAMFWEKYFVTLYAGSAECATSSVGTTHDDSIYPYPMLAREDLVRAFENGADALVFLSTG